MDNPGLSPSGSVFALGVVEGLDRLHAVPFVLDTALFGALVFGLAALARRGRRD